MADDGGWTIESHRDDDLPSTVSSFDLGDCRRHLAERVPGPDHRLDLACLDEFLEDDEVFAVWSRKEVGHLLADERRDRLRPDNPTHAEPTPTAFTPGEDESPLRSQGRSCEPG